MVRIKPSYRIQVCGTKMRPQWRAPLGSLNRPADNHRPDTEPCKKPCRRSSLLRVLRPQALRNTSAARRQAAKLCYRFDLLTPSARSANLIAGDGTKNGFPAPNKEQTTHQKRLLDRKSPIQVRIRLPPAASQLPDFLALSTASRSRIPLRKGVHPTSFNPRSSPTHRKSGAASLLPHIIPRAVVLDPAVGWAGSGHLVTIGVPW